MDTLRGLLTAILTPFDLEGNLRLDGMPALVEFQQAGGADGLVVCGTNGEGTSLSVEERKRTLEAVMACRGGLSIVAATGACSVTDAVELTRHAEDAGADAILALPPFFVKNPATAGLAAYFRAVLDAARLPVLLYSIPQFTAVPVTDELLDALADRPNLFGIKDSGGDWGRTQDLLQRRPALRIFCGDERAAARSYAGGGFVISGAANAFPEVVAAVRDAHEKGGGIEAAQVRAEGMVSILKRYPFVGASKSVLARRGLPRMGVRPPLVTLTPEQETAMLADFRDGGFLRPA